MSRGRFLSLEEARNSGQLDQFAREHPSEAERARFERLLEAMAKGVLEDKETLPPGHDEGSSETRTRKDT
jgi:hypothetical protein